MAENCMSMTGVDTERDQGRSKGRRGLRNRGEVPEVKLKKKAPWVWLAAAEHCYI